MRFKPLHIGDAYTLDDYNATFYMLSHDEWKEEPFDLGYTPHQGNLASYQLYDPYDVIFLRREKYIVSEEISNHNTIQIIVIDPILAEADYSIRLTYSPNEYISNKGNLKLGEVDANDECLDENSAINYNTNVIGNTKTVDLPLEFIQEQIVTYNKWDDTYYTELPSDNDQFSVQKRRRYKVTLPSDFEQATAINHEVEMLVDVHPKPEIDPWNGKANEPDEIVIYPDRNVEYYYTWDTLKTMIDKAPTNGKKHIFRLIHDNHKGYVLDEIHIKNGQNIEIRGGTNTRTIMDGDKVPRIFHVEAGGKLTLDHIQLQNCTYLPSKARANTTGNGLGGAILVDYSDLQGDYASWGTLTAYRCRFENCSALHGGAIYAYHARIDIRTCYFHLCTTWSDTGTANYGGGICYNTLIGYDFL